MSSGQVFPPFVISSSCLISAPCGADAAFQPFLKVCSDRSFRVSARPDRLSTYRPFQQWHDFSAVWVQSEPESDQIFHTEHLKAAVYCRELWSQTHLKEGRAEQRRRRSILVDVWLLCVEPNRIYLFDKGKCEASTSLRTGLMLTCFSLMTLGA